MEPEPKPSSKKIFDEKDPHVSGRLLIIALLTALFHWTLLGDNDNPLQEVVTGLAFITLFYLLASLFYPQKPRWFWYLCLTLGALSICFVFTISAF
jgi:hypothetical protein